MRELHARMDAAVLAAYGWTDLPTACDFILDCEEEEEVASGEGRGAGNFEYEPAFVKQGWPVAPLMMPLGPGIFAFSTLKRETFHGLPGLLADALPDRFGNRLINLWLERQGRAPEDFTPVER